MECLILYTKLKGDVCMDKDDLLAAITALVEEGKIYTTDTTGEFDTVNIVGVEVDPDGDIKLITEVRS